MQEAAGSSRSSKVRARPALTLGPGQGNPSDASVHARASTSTAGNNYDTAQHAASTPQTISTSSAAPTSVGSLSTSADYFPAPLHYLQSQEQMSLSQPQQQPPNPPTVDYGPYTYPPGGALVWDFDSTLETPDFATLYEPQGELLQELQDHQQPEGDFSLPEPFSDRETGLSDAAQSAATQQPLGSAVESPIQMPVVLGGTAHQPQPQQQQQQQGARAVPRMMGMQYGQNPGHLKRKSVADQPVLPVAKDDAEPSSKRPARARTGSTTASAPFERKALSVRSQSDQGHSHPALTIQTSDPGPMDDTGSAPGSAHPPTEPGARSATSERPSASGKARRVPETPTNFNNILPAGKVFPIQIGSELFRLSGASISSDGVCNLLMFALVEIDKDTYGLAAPSYFSHFFSDQLLNNAGKSGTIRTLYIDRDPQTFRDISLHLQGYHVKPRDGEHYVRLFADAQFYSLPRLTQQLFKTDIYIQIGDKNFQIPRDIFSAPGNSPNFFSLGFAHFFSTPSEVFPGLDRTSLLRPPSIQPPSVPNRSAEVFQDLLHLLQGYPVNIRGEGHRQDLLRDARYFHLKGLEQKLIPCNVSYNLNQQQSEIVVRLEDIRQSGVSFQPDSDSAGQNSDSSSATGGGHGRGQSTPQPRAAASPRALTPAAAASGYTNLPTGQICYARPFTDENAHVLIVETSTAEATRIDLAAMRATFTDQTKARITSLFQVIANKMNLPATQPLGLMMVERGGGIAALPVSPNNSGVSGDRVRVSIDRDSWCEINGGAIEWASEDDDDDEHHHHNDNDNNKHAASVDDEDGEDHAMHHDYSDEDNAVRRTGLPPIRRWRPSGASADQSLDTLGELVVSKAQWRLKVRASDDDARIVEVVMQVVKLQGWVGERNRNGARGFLV